MPPTYILNVRSLTSEAVLKMTKETNAGDVETICVRVTKPASKKVANTEVDLN